MTWNHRILRQTVVMSGEEHHGFALHEVFYDDDDNPTSWTKEPVGIAGDTYDETAEVYMQMSQAFMKPVLEIVGDKLVERRDKL